MSAKLQKLYTNGSWKLSLNPIFPYSDSATFPLDALRLLLPKLKELMQPYDLTDALESIRIRERHNISPPEYTPQAPIRSNFWNVSSDGEELSIRGSFPLTRGPSEAQYKAVLHSQQHLKALNMLHGLEDIQIMKLINQLDALREISPHSNLLGSLIHGLAFNEVHVYKGLDTGFQLPGVNVQLWGLSAPTNPSTLHEIDIFISQKAASEAGVILHTYLAHHGIHRMQIYEELLRLDQVSEGNDKLELPIIIQGELADATNSELLFLLEQLRVSGVDHPLVRTIKNTCKSLLIEESSQAAWTEAHSQGFLEGTVTMEELLQQRLEEYTRKGARKLPLIENLIILFDSISEVMADALYQGNRHVLHSFMNALLAVFNPRWDWISPESVDYVTDLFALMVYCALRKAAFEDVYLETTDRCPFFINQPDQAAVFAELWVLGSQCDNYFGILPRALGQIIFDRYRKSLRDEPPPANAWNGTNIFTAYSITPTAKSNLSPQSSYHEYDSEFWARKAYLKFKNSVLELGALSIFCMPAIVDVCLLTFVGRGFFLTAFMRDEERLMATYALLASLLISAGVTGWVGSVGGYYSSNVRGFKFLIFSCAINPMDTADKISISVRFQQHEFLPRSETLRRSRSCCSSQHLRSNCLFAALLSTHRRCLCCVYGCLVHLLESTRLVSFFVNTLSSNPFSRHDGNDAPKKMPLDVRSICFVENNPIPSSLADTLNLCT
jgi:hypothetical protein